MLRGTLEGRLAPWVVLTCLLLIQGQASACESDGRRSRRAIGDEPTSAGARPIFLQMQFGLASESDFGPALLFRYERPETSTDVAAVSMGKQISDSLFGWPAVVVAYGSLQSFGERGRQPDILGATAYMKVYRQFYLGERGLPVRIGLGTRRGLAARRGGWGKGVRFASHGDVSLR